MPPAPSASAPARSAKVRRSPLRRTGESAFGLLLLGQRVLMGLLALLLIVVGVYASWDSAKYVMLTQGREKGSMAVAHCGDEVCTGTFTPASPDATPREKARVDASVAVEAGETIPAVAKPNGRDMVRAGTAGLLYAWVPLGGALVLAALVIAGGLRWNRTAWVTGLGGLALVSAAFAALW